MTLATCSVSGCVHPVHSRGLCLSHYSRWHDGRDIEAPMSRRDAPRLPLEPLLAVVTRRVANGVHNNTGQGDLARLTGANRRAIVRWKADGGVPIHYADEVAVALGVHPCEVWGDAWWAACAAADAGTVAA